MGYYTNYKLSIHADGKQFVHQEDAQQEIADLSGYSNPFSESCKWYSHEQDMKALSKNHPDTVFLLEGEGEETGDIWKKYFKNGKMQVCKSEILFPPFDEVSLK